MPEEAKPGAATGPDAGGGAAPARKKPRITSPRKGGVVGRAVDAVAAPLSALRPPELDWKLVSWGLLVLIAIILVARNWAPVRINIFGWYLDLPKALAFVLFFVLGGLTMWLIDARAGKRKRSQATEAVSETGSNTQVPAEEGEEDMDLPAEAPETDEQQGL